MITITPLSTNQIVIWNDLFINYGDIQIVMTKRDLQKTLTFNPQSITDYDNKWTLFIIEDVELINQDLPNGKVALNRWPGEWDFILQSKASIASNWINVYLDLSRVLDKNIQYQA